MQWDEVLQSFLNDNDRVKLIRVKHQKPKTFHHENAKKKCGLSTHRFSLLKTLTLTPKFFHHWECLA